jgi:hypothetical protein
MRYKKNRKSRTGDKGSTEERRVYYESRPKCSHCHYRTDKKGKEIGKDGWKAGLPKAFKDKWKLLEHYNKAHPDLVDEIRYLFDDSEIVTCPICGAFMGQIGHKHLEKHSLTTKEFKEQYPNSPMRPDKMKQTWSDRCKEFNKTEFMKEAVSSSLLEGHRNGKYDEIKEKASQKKKEKFASGELVVWNKGLTKNDHPSIMSTSKKMRKMWSNNQLTNGRTIGKFYSNKNNEYIDYRSTYELKAFELLEKDEKVNGYIYESIRIRYRGYDGLLHTYYPDILTDDGRLIEIKAGWILKEENKKYSEDIFRKFAAAEKWAKKNGYTFEVWTEKELGL